MIIINVYYVKPLSNGIIFYAAISTGSLGTFGFFTFQVGKPTTGLVSYNPTLGTNSAEIYGGRIWTIVPQIYTL